MNTIIYARVSTNKQGDSEEMQIEKCEKYCSMMGYSVKDVLIDSNVSGGIELFERPEGCKIKKYISNKEIDHIVCWDLTRLFRDVVDGLTTINVLNDKGITFSIINLGGNIIDTSTPMGEMVTTMFLAMGRLEKQTTRDRVKKSLNHRKESLRVYSKNTPYGFKKSGDNLIVNKEEMEVVKAMYQMKDEKSYRFIADSYKLNVSKVYRILNDGFYKRFI